MPTVLHFVTFKVSLNTKEAYPAEYDFELKVITMHKIGILYCIKYIGINKFIFVKVNSHYLVIKNVMILLLLLLGLWLWL